MRMTAAYRHALAVGGARMHTPARWVPVCALSTVLLAGAPLTAVAQSAWGVTVEGGAQRVSLTPPSNAAASPLRARSALTVGVLVRRQFDGVADGRFAVEAGLGLSSRGAQWRVPIGEPTAADVQLRAWTLDLPVLAHVQVL